MCDIKHTAESRKIHADLSFKLAEKIMFVVASSLLAAPAAMLLGKESSEVVCLYYGTALAGSLLVFWLVRFALKLHLEIDQNNDQPKSDSAETKNALPESKLNAVHFVNGNKINISITIEPTQGEKNDSKN